MCVCVKGCKFQMDWWLWKFNWIVWSCEKEWCQGWWRWWWLPLRWERDIPPPPRLTIQLRKSVRKSDGEIGDGDGDDKDGDGDGDGDDGDGCLFSESATFLLLQGWEELCIFQLFALLTASTLLQTLLCLQILSRFQPPLVSYPVNLGELSGTRNPKNSFLIFCKQTWKKKKKHSLIQEHNHLLACASKQSWNASIAVTIALLLHKVHLHMTTITLWSDIIFHHDLLKCLVFSIVDFMIGRRWWGRRCWCQWQSTTKADNCNDHDDDHDDDDHDEYDDHDCD